MVFAMGRRLPGADRCCWPNAAACAAEADLRDSEERFLMLVENVP